MPRADRWTAKPELITEISEMGDYYVQEFLDNYAGARIDQLMPIFDRAFALLTERGNFCRANAFGEMHCDSYMWIEKCEHSKVIVYEIQSARFLFIKENLYDETYGDDEPPMFGKFHIRQLYFKHQYPTWKKEELKHAKLKYFRDLDFKPTYCDSRGVGYKGTATHDILRDYATTVKDATMETIQIMDKMRFWEHYLDDPENLE